MSLDFDKYAAKGNEMLNMLSADLRVPKDKAGRILRTVLHTIRNHISLDESLQIIAQLPMALKSVYVDQWDPWHSFFRIRHVDEFINKVRENDKKASGDDLGNSESNMHAVQAVFRMLDYNLTNGEFKEITAVLPHELKEFVTNSIGHRRIAL